jgi:hypothetical protein
MSLVTFESTSLKSVSENHIADLDRDLKFSGQILTSISQGAWNVFFLLSEKRKAQQRSKKWLEQQRQQAKQETHFYSLNL